MRIGIDRVLLKHLEIKQIDINSLQANNFTVIKDNEKNIRIFKDATTGEDIKINYIKVSKKHNKSLVINELRIGRMEIQGALLNKINYEHLDVTLPISLSDKRTNESNISTTEELRQALGEVEKELEYLGFGKVDLLNTELKEMEVNLNIELERPFREYERVLNYFNSLLPTRLKRCTNAKYKAQNNYTGYKVGNGSVTLKMYDKRTDILKKTKIDIEKELLRIEYSFMNEQKIKDTFGSNKLKDIDFEVLAETYRGLLYDDLIKRLYKDIDRQLNHAVREIEQYKKTTGGISAIDSYLKNYQNNLIDIEIVLGALKELDRSSHFSREAKKAIKSALEIEGVVLFGNINKVNEILKALEYEEIKIKMTPSIIKTVKKHY